MSFQSAAVLALATVSGWNDIKGNQFEVQCFYLKTQSRDRGNYNAK